MEAPNIATFDYVAFDRRMNKHRDFEGCLDMVLSYMSKQGPNVEIEVHKKAILAVLLCRDLDDSQTVELLAQARSQSDWNDVHEGDILRDVAINLIRQNEFDGARECLNRAFPMHASDFNRIACLWGVYARIEANTGDLDYALKIFDRTSRLWSEIGDKADPIWINNARSHWLLTMAKAGVRRFDKKRLRVCWQITLKEKNWKKRAIPALLQVFDKRVVGFIERHA